MTTSEVAQKLVEYCKQGKWELAIEELYAPNIESIEMKGASLLERVSGLDEIRAKGKKWESMVQEMHGIEIKGPIVAGSHFSIAMAMDITMKGAPRMKNEEVYIYEVTGGKITKEQFFYSLPSV